MNKSLFNVCLIDDDRIYQFTAKKVLESTKLATQILSFTNGADGLSFIHTNLTKKDVLPDVIFLDINMPIMDGWQFLKEFALLETKLPKPIRIFMVSSSVDDYDIKKSKEHTCITNYVIKPIYKEKFHELLMSTPNS
jgi:two-component system, chemotaxis family, chemotaxis protein CheY